MRRRDFIRIVGAGAAAPLWPALARGMGGDSRHPNIVLILADDLGYGDLSCYGNDVIKTPNLDSLAKSGMKFTDFHSNGPVCSPTRAALLTGRYQQRTGIEAVITATKDREMGMALNEVTFAEVLKPLGYATAIFGKWHLGYQPRFSPVQQGFDVFQGYVSGNIDYQSHIDQAGYEDWWEGTGKNPEEGYTTHLITDDAVNFIGQHKNGPFCLYLPYETPHYPYQGPHDKADRTPGHPEPIYGSRKDRAGAYKEMIEDMDRGVGLIMQSLRKHGLESNTFVFFCSDNGPWGPGSSGPLRGKKATLWEGGHRVPAIAYWPGKVSPGTVSHETVMTMDLFPTFASIAQAPVPRSLKLDGVNLLPALLRGESLPHRTLFWRFKNQKAVRSGPWKLDVNCPGSPGTSLYNLASDIGEEHDLSKEEHQRVLEMEAAFSNWEKDVTAGVKEIT
jgi:arylsulfatase A-like enzyme